MFTKVLKHLSPSSFQVWKRCPLQFWLIKFSGHVFEDEQGLPAAMGCAYDMFIKRWVAHKIGMGDHPKLSTRSLLTSVQLPEGTNREEVLAAGANLAEIYIKRGLADRLLKENVVDLELELMISIGDMRLLGKPDGVIKTFVDGVGPPIYVPLDWKVRGYKSKHGYSPTPGYKTYVTTDGKVKTMHSKCGTPLELLNENWAIQMAIYSWLLNPDIVPGSQDMPIAIEEVCHGAKTVAFTQIRTHVTKEFQQKLLAELITCWASCQEEPKDTIYDGSRCFAYNMRCRCADVCEAFQRNVNSPFRAMNR